MAELIVGIDLGTTNSEIAYVKDGQPRIINVDGEAILPSVVGLDQSGKILVGKPARNQYVIYPERTIRSIKRKMGQEVQVPLGEQKYRPQEISAIILRRLKEAAEAELGQPVTKAVVTVPAYYNDTQRQATREAGSLAGLDVVRILNEPTAAALTYKPNPTARQRILVYDLGGGTFDVSIVQAEQGVFEVLSSHGDTQLGGDDFDELLLNKLADEFQETYQIDLRANRTTAARLLRAVEQAKKVLSDLAVTTIEEEFIAEREGVPVHLSREIFRSEVEELIRPLLDRTMGCVQKAMQDANLQPADIDEVVLVGGSTRTPLIGQLLEARLGHPAHREIHPDLCVALGAAVQGAIIAGESVGSVLVDITPHSMGIKSLEIPQDYQSHYNEHRFTPILNRNTPLPASRSEVFCTVSDYQQKVEIEVFQGNSNDVRRNHLVGKFNVEGLARVPAGNQIIVQMDLNLDGLLKVSAREKATGLVKHITIDNAMARFAVEERDAAQERLNRLWDKNTWGEDNNTADTSDDDEPSMSLADLLPPPTEDYDDLEGLEDGDDADDADDADDQEDWSSAGTNEPEADNTARRATQADAPPTGQSLDLSFAEDLLFRAKRVLPNLNDEDRGTVEQLIEAIQAAIQQSDLELAKARCTELNDVLFYLEDL